jgi:hypothetical protein
LLCFAALSTSRALVFGDTPSLSTYTHDTHTHVIRIHNQHSSTEYVLDDKANQYDEEALLWMEEQNIACVCPPEPRKFSEIVISYTVYFLTVEYGLRVLLFSPADPADTYLGYLRQYMEFLFSFNTIIDALAIFPYYFESLPNGLISLRLLRLFRVFQFVKFGKYNAMFNSLTIVLGQLVHYLKLLILVLAFAAAFFGSMMFWLERGSWKYYEPIGQFAYIRTGVDGVSDEISPFGSIPNGIWWFMVTATTVGYGGTTKEKGLVGICFGVVSEERKNPRKSFPKGKASHLARITPPCYSHNACWFPWSCSLFCVRIVCVRACDSILRHRLLSYYYPRALVCHIGHVDWNSCCSLSCLGIL